MIVAGKAQMVEHGFRKPKVVGSSPTVGLIILKRTKCTHLIGICRYIRRQESRWNALVAQLNRVSVF